MVLLAQAAVTPAGKPAAVPIPVAPEVVWLIGIKAVVTHKVGVDEAALAVFAFTVIVPVAFALPHPPVSGME